MRLLLCLAGPSLLIAGLIAGGALAQERRGLAMPADMPRFATAPPNASDAPPGLSRMLTVPVDPGSSTSIAASGDTPPSRAPRFDVYNNLTRGTWDQISQGRYPSGPGVAAQLANENRWAMPPAVGLVVQTPLGAPNANGLSPMSVGVNAGPSVDPYGTAGMSINARLRMPFGR